MTLSYIDYLQGNFSDNPPKRKGLRTRARLQIATAKVLEQKGYHALRISDVTESAETAEGSFYLYFKDKADVTLSVLSGMVDEYFSLQMGRTGASEAHEAIRNANRQWIALCRQNAGLMRCVFQLADEEPTFASLLHRANRQWYGRVSESIARQRAGAAPRAGLFGAYLLGSMMDELVRRLIVYPDSEFLAVLSEIGADDLAVADAASLMWLKVLYAKPPRLENLPPAAAELGAWMGGLEPTGRRRSTVAKP